MKKLTFNGKSFRPFIPYEKIAEAIDKVADRLNSDYSGCKDVPVLLCVLNGSIMFTAELMKRLEFQCELVSMKLSSYSGARSTGKVRQVMGMSGSVEGRRVIIVEDIVDSGTTISDLDRILKEKGATEVKVCTMLFKPDAYKMTRKLDYVAMEIPNDFIVGFGLDYDELGRNLKDIYVLDEEPDCHIEDKSSDKMKYYILFGPPGAGKGTQAANMVSKYNLCHLSTGDLLRGEMAAGTELGKKAKSLIEAGSLVPDEVVEGMIENKFKNTDGVAGFLLDGFPRTIAQADALDSMLARSGEGVTAVVSLMIPDEMIRERIKHRASIEGRADDANDDTISNRIRTYHEKTEPLVDYYKKEGKYREIDGTASIEEVRAAIEKVMEEA